MSTVHVAGFAAEGEVYMMDECVFGLCLGKQLCPIVLPPTMMIHLQYQGCGNGLSQFQYESCLVKLVVYDVIFVQRNSVISRVPCQNGVPQA